MVYTQLIKFLGHFDQARKITAFTFLDATRAIMRIACSIKVRPIKSINMCAK